MPGPLRRDSVKPLSFYDVPENEIYNMANDHFDGSKDIKVTFSSWGASLHLVLCYAKFLQNENESTYVAVMDTHALGDEVMAWHVPHLMGRSSKTHEYLAFGRIRGAYQAVSLSKLERHSLYTLFPELA